MKSYREGASNVNGYDQFMSRSTDEEKAEISLQRERRALVVGAARQLHAAIGERMEVAGDLHWELRPFEQRTSLDLPGDLIALKRIYNRILADQRLLRFYRAELEAEPEMKEHLDLGELSYTEDLLENLAERALDLYDSYRRTLAKGRRGPIRPVDVPLALRAMRLEAGLNQAELAERMGIGAPAISQFERGPTKKKKRTPSLDRISAWADATGHRAYLLFVPDERFSLDLIDIASSLDVTRERRHRLSTVLLALFARIREDAWEETLDEVMNLINAKEL